MSQSHSMKANTCTIELSTGSFIEVALTPEEVIQARTVALETGDGEMLELPKQMGTGRADAKYREMTYVVPEHIGAIHPLDERPSPPRRIYVDRIEATTA